MHNNKLVSQRGFTLVEVLTVLLVLVAIASITVESTKDFVFQGRYDVTKDRYEKIKKAIVGDANQVINGQPNISGFVADMGRLPTCLRELKDGFNCENQGSCSDAAYTDKTACKSNAGTWTLSTAAPAPPTWQQIVSAHCLDAVYTTQLDCENNSKVWIPETKLGAGWRGAYLQVNNDSDLSDGWGNSSNDGDYGWMISLAAGDFTIKSKGKDQRPSTDGCSNYDDDCGYAIKGTDYSKTITALTLNITPLDERTFHDNGVCSNVSTSTATKNDCVSAGFGWTANISPVNPITPQQLCLKVYYRQNGKITAAISNNPTVATIIEGGSASAVLFEFSATQISNGVNALGVYKYNGTSCDFSNEIYPAGHPLQHALFAPYKSLDNLNW